jgi:hypothetical protein
MVLRTESVEVERVNMGLADMRRVAAIEKGDSPFTSCMLSSALFGTCMILRESFRCP